MGGAAYLVAKAIKGSRVLAFEDLGMEAIYEFDVKDMPVTVASRPRGQSSRPDLARMISVRPAAILFDMDGLLLDTERLIRGVMIAVMADMGFAMDDSDYAALIGRPEADSAALMRARFGGGLKYDEVRLRVAQRLQDRHGDHRPLKPGATALLAQVNAAGILCHCSGPAGHRAGRGAGAGRQSQRRHRGARRRRAGDHGAGSAAGHGRHPPPPARRGR